MGKLEPKHFNIIIGVNAVSFVVFQVAKEKTFNSEKPFVSGHGTGVVYGIGPGLTSTLTHGARPMVNIFMIPKRLSKEEFVSPEYCPSLGSRCPFLAGAMDAGENLVERNVFAVDPRQSEVESENPRGKIPDPRIYPHVARRITPH